MNTPLEVLLDARKALQGVHSDTSTPDIESAVNYILEYLLAKEIAEENYRICKLIDKAQSIQDLEKVTHLMVDRDKVLSLLK